MTEMLKVELGANLPRAFLQADLVEKLDLLQEKYSFSDSTRSRLTANIERLDLKWNKRASHSLFHIKDRPVNDLDILEALTRRRHSYLSHFSAIYFNELNDQRPKDHFITTELGKNRINTPINEFKIRQAFTKPARVSQNFFSYGKTSFYLLEKERLSAVGVISKLLRHSGSEHNIKMTCPERTFIDSIVAPQYSGGIQNVVQSFKSVSLDFEKLVEIYRLLKPVYPFWQSTGFILEHTNHRELARKWEARFQDHQKIPFYIAHSAKATWVHSDRWKTFYPGELFDSAD